jgi:hypothetical protein
VSLPPSAATRATALPGLPGPHRGAKAPAYLHMLQAWAHAQPQEPGRLQSGESLVQCIYMYGPQHSQHTSLQLLLLEYLSMRCSSSTMLNQLIKLMSPSNEALQQQHVWDIDCSCTAAHHYHSAAVPGLARISTLRLINLLASRASRHLCTSDRCCCGVSMTLQVSCTANVQNPTAICLKSIFYALLQCPPGSIAPSAGSLQCEKCSEGSTTAKGNRTACSGEAAHPERPAAAGQPGLVERQELALSSMAAVT